MPRCAHISLSGYTLSQWVWPWHVSITCHPVLIKSEANACATTELPPVSSAWFRERFRTSRTILQQLVWPVWLLAAAALFLFVTVESWRPSGAVHKRTRWLKRLKGASLRQVGCASGRVASWRRKCSCTAGNRLEDDTTLQEDMSSAYLLAVDQAMDVLESNVRGDLVVAF